MPKDISLQTEENEGNVVNISSLHSVEAPSCIEIGSLSVAAKSSALPTRPSMPDKLIGMQFIQSMPRYATNFSKPTEWVSDGPVHKLCVSKKRKPQLLKFWVTGRVSAQYLGAMRTYQNTYAVDLEVTDDVMAVIHAFFEAGSQKTKTYSY